MQYFLLAALLATSALAGPIEVNVFDKRDTYPKVSTKLSSYKETVSYGSENPVDMVDKLNTECSAYECNTQFSVQSRYASEGGNAKTITIYCDGSWVDTADGKNPKSDMINALKKVVGSRVKVKQESSGPGGRLGEAFVNEHFASTNSGITRSVIEKEGFEPEEQGNISFYVKIESSGSDGCSAITSALSAIAGAISAISAIFFGVVSPAVCAAVG